MPVYVTLYKFTDQGIKDIKNIPDGIAEAVKIFEGMGGKVLGLYSTLGEYDFVGLGEVPSDEVAFAFALQLGAAGNVRTTTLKAFPVEQFAELVKKLP